MFSKIASRHIPQFHQRLFQDRPAENINSHRCKIAFRFRRLFLKFCNPSVPIGYNNSKAACFFHRNRHSCYGNICMIFFMVIQHHLIVHLVNMVSRQDQDIIRIVGFHIIHILVNCIGCSRVPFAVCAFLVWRQDGHPSNIAVQIPRNTNPYMCIKP